MIDIHDAHHAASTWRDFFIHIATIVLGLIIAVSLEQTVEWMHHLNQRHELEQELRAEGLRNKAIIESEFSFQDAIRRYELDYKSYSDQMLALHTRTLPPPPEIAADAAWLNSHTSLQPFTTAWDTARESQTVALLPPEEAAAYSALYLALNKAFNRREGSEEASATLADFITRFRDRGSPHPVYARMTDAQLDELSALEAAAANRVSRYRLFLGYAYTRNQAMLNSTPDHPPTDKEVADAASKMTRDFKSDLGTDPYAAPNPAK